MIEYRVLCDGCGAFIASSCASVRSARAEAQMKHGANKGPDGDHCVDCRKKRNVLSQEDMERANAAAHSTIGRSSNW